MPRRSAGRRRAARYVGRALRIVRKLQARVVDALPVFAPPLIFAISLKAKMHADDWDAVQANLRSTILSAIGSDGSRSRIIVACHDIPEDVAADFPGVTFLRVPFPPPDNRLAGSRDKIRKRGFVGCWLRKHGARGQYVMFLDADDLVHRSLAAHVLRTDSRGAYIVDQGYEFDRSTGTLAVRDRGFERNCGSCFVAYFKRGELPQDLGDRKAPYLKFRAHKHFRSAAEQLGKSVAVVPFPAVVYVINHTESMRVLKRGRMRKAIGSVLAGAAATDALRAFGYAPP